jgi:hypothetical protein
MEEYKEAEGPDRDKRAELLTRLVASVGGIKGFEGKTAKEVFDPDNEQGRRGLIERLSDEEYSDLITGINGILRGEKKEEWKMDGVGVTAIGHEVVGGHIFPRDADKKDLIVQSWKAAQEMNTNQRNLEEIGMLLGSLLVETHPFADGNGRTSRLVYFMVKNGFSEDQVKAILSDDGRWEFDMALSKVDIDPLFDAKYGGNNPKVNKHRIGGMFADAEADAFGQLVFSEGIDPKTKRGIIDAARNDDHIFLAGVLHFLNEHPEINADECVQDFQGRKILLLQNLLSRATKEQIMELSEKYWGLKKKYTEGMIDIFVHPDKPEYKVKRGGKEMRMLDYFKQRIAQGIVLM